jgi:hypothetical protein
VEAIDKRQGAKGHSRAEYGGGLAVGTGVDLEALLAPRAVQRRAEALHLVGSGEDRCQACFWRRGRIFLGSSDQYPSSRMLGDGVSDDGSAYPGSEPPWIQGVGHGPQYSLLQASVPRLYSYTASVCSAKPLGVHHHLQSVIPDGTAA